MSQHGEAIEAGAVAEAGRGEGKGKGEAAGAAADGDKDKMSPGIQAAVAAAEAKFDKKMEGLEKKEASKATGDDKEEKKEPKAAMAGSRRLTPKLHAAGSRAAVRAAEEKRAHNAVQLGVDSHDAAYSEAMAREESRSLERRSAEAKLKQKELKVHEATKTVRDMREALARRENQGKSAAVAKELAEQSSLIGDGLGEEESFSAMAKRGEVRHTVQERITRAGASMKAVAAAAAKRLGSSPATKGGSTSRLRGKERSLMAKALEEQAAAGREQSQWQAQQLKTREMQREEAAAVQSANSIYSRHMIPLSHVSKLYSDYESKLQREEEAYSKAEFELQKGAEKK